MIRLAKNQDMDTIMNIYAVARRYMADNGNPAQWGAFYPAREMLEDDIIKGQLYVCTKENEIHGVFAFMTGEEETYSYIEDGAWKNDAPYGTIHRIAGDGKKKGVFAECLDFCKEKISNLRIDTHHDNHKMQHLIEKNGFEKCGVIYVQDGTPRIAYQYAP